MNDLQTAMNEAERRAQLEEQLQAAYARAAQPDATQADRQEAQRLYTLLHGEPRTQPTLAPQGSPRRD